VKKQKKIKLVAKFAFGTLSALGSTHAFASSFSWAPASGTNSWNSAANWVPETVGTTFPNGAGDIANINNNITGTTTINLNTSIVVGTLNLGDFDGSNSIKIASGTGTNTLTFNSGSSAAAQLNIRKELIAGDEIASKVALASDLNLSLEPTTTNGNRHTITLSGILDLGSKALTVTGGFKRGIVSDTDATQVTLSGDIVGSLTSRIISSGDSPVQITGIKTNFLGIAVANGPGVGGDNNSTGSFILNGGSLKYSAEIIINGNGDGASGGRVRIGTNSSNTPLAEQRLTQNRMTLNGGYLSDQGVGLVAGNTTYLQADTVANFNFNSGFSIVDVAGHTSSAGNVLTATTLERSTGATGFLRIPGAAVGTASQTVISRMIVTNNPTAFVVGSTATSGANTRIVPWLVASTTSSNFNFAGFATYDNTEGFRVLKSGEFVADSVTAGNNITASTSAVLTGLANDISINSLLYSASTTASIDNVADATTRTLSIASGGIIFTGSTGKLGAANDAAKAGAINFGAAEGVIFSQAGNSNGIGARLVGSSGFTKGGGGILTLTGINSGIYGPVNVSAGTLQIGDGTNNSTIGVGNQVHVHAGATLRLSLVPTGSVIDGIADYADLVLDSYGLFNASVVIDSGTETVQAFVVNGIVQATGTYGRTGSGANNYGGIWVTYFTSGTGILNVTMAPEPSSLSFIGLGALGALRRRRR